jgi:hypothetical protein
MVPFDDWLKRCPHCGFLLIGGTGVRYPRKTCMDRRRRRGCAFEPNAWQDVCALTGWSEQELLREIYIVATDHLHRKRESGKDVARTIEEMLNLPARPPKIAEELNLTPLRGSQALAEAAERLRSLVEIPETLMLLDRQKLRSAWNGPRLVLGSHDLIV